MNKWFVNFPTYNYVEDVKELAKKNSLKIIDAKFQGKEEQCENAPKLTLKSESKENKKSKRDLLIEEALSLDIEFADNIKNVDLEKLIADKKVDL